MSTVSPGLQRLLGEAEALDLLEIFADLVGADVEHRLAGDGPRREVLRAVEDLGLRAGLDPDRRLLRLEPPRQAGMDVGVEADADLARDRARARARPEAACRRSRSPRRRRGTAAPRRRRGRSSPRRSRAMIIAVRRSVLGNRGHQFIPVLAMVMKNSSTTNAPSSSAMIRARSRWRCGSVRPRASPRQPAVGDERRVNSANR